MVTYWVSRWILNFQLKRAFVEKWILNLPLNIEFRLAEFMNIEHDEVSIEDCIFGRIWIFVKILNFRWIFDFRLSVEFGHWILFFFVFFFTEYWSINEKSNFCWILNSCWILKFYIKYWICDDWVLNFHYWILNI